MAQAMSAVCLRNGDDETLRIRIETVLENEVRAMETVHGASNYSANACVAAASCVGAHVLVATTAQQHGVTNTLPVALHCVPGPVGAPSLYG